jgi:serine/threonine protein kinase
MALRGHELRDRLGEGAFGTVHRAFQPAVQRDVAIKVIKPELANDPEFIRRFEIEAQLVARLEHLHIVPLYDYWREPDGTYLVMRLLPGGSLKEILADGALGYAPDGTRVATASTDGVIREFPVLLEDWIALAESLLP